MFETFWWLDNDLPVLIHVCVYNIVYFFCSRGMGLLHNNMLQKFNI